MAARGKDLRMNLVGSMFSLFSGADRSRETARQGKKPRPLGYSTYIEFFEVSLLGCSQAVFQVHAKGAHWHCCCSGHVLR